MYAKPESIVRKISRVIVVLVVMTTLVISAVSGHFKTYLDTKFP